MLILDGVVSLPVVDVEFDGADLNHTAIITFELNDDLAAAIESDPAAANVDYRNDETPIELIGFSVVPRRTVRVVPTPPDYALVTATFRSEDGRDLNIGAARRWLSQNDWKAEVHDGAGARYPTDVLGVQQLPGMETELHWTLQPAHQLSRRAGEGEIDLYFTYDLAAGVTL